MAFYVTGVEESCIRVFKDNQGAPLSRRKIPSQTPTPSTSISGIILSWSYNSEKGLYIDYPRKIGVPTCWFLDESVIYKVF